MAPYPYLAVKLPYTIIIEPWEVLIALKNKSTYVRAYTELFVNELSKKCNIIYWTQYMPNLIDKYLEYLPKGENIYTLYRYHCRYVISCITIGKLKLFKITLENWM